MGLLTVATSFIRSGRGLKILLNVESQARQSRKTNGKPFVF